MNNGIVNLGNTCYMNSIIQCIVNLDFLTLEDETFLQQSTILSEKNNFDLVKEWLKMLKQIKSEDKVNVNPTGFCKCFIDKLKEHNYYFINFQQNDVGEFMTILFDLLHKCLEYKVNMEYEGEIKHSYDKIAVESIKAWKSFFDSSYSYIVKKTYNQLLSITNCPECNYSTYNHDPIQVITLDVKEKDTKLYDILDNYVNLDKLDDNNKWKCDKCKKDVNPEKKNVFWNLSDILIIQLKRYRIDGNRIIKINNHIDFPESLCMNKYNMNYYDNSNNYKLTSFSVQSGGMNFGHYYAVCKENDKWICYNDTNIQEIDKKNAFALSPYCLFYKRII